MRTAWRLARPCESQTKPRLRLEASQRERLGSTSSSALSDAPNQLASVAAIGRPRSSAAAGPGRHRRACRCSIAGARAVEAPPLTAPPITKCMLPQPWSEPSSFDCSVRPKSDAVKVVTLSATPSARGRVVERLHRVGDAADQQRGMIAQQAVVHVEAAERDEEHLPLGAEFASTPRSSARPSSAGRRGCCRSGTAGS